jgi:hypothetical protein
VDDLSFQGKAEAAAVYEDLFVPALFQEWANRVADAARLKPGDRDAGTHMAGVAE